MKVCSVLFCVCFLFLLSLAANVEFVNYIEEEDYDELMTYSTKDGSAFSVYRYYSSRVHHNICMLYDTVRVTRGSTEGYPIHITDAYTYLGRGANNIDVSVSFSIYKVNRLNPVSSIGERIGYSGSLQAVSAGPVLHISDLEIDVYEPYFWACFSVYRNADTSDTIGFLYEPIELAEAAPWSFSCSSSDGTVTSANALSPFDSSSRFFIGLSYDEISEEDAMLLWDSTKESCKNGYGDGQTCNCECGIVDPDCYDKDVTNNTCGEGKACIEGVCVDIGWPKTEFCDVSNFGDGKVCNCGCGGNYYDPDCLFALFRTYKCDGVSSLCDLSTFTCQNDTWTCDVSRYSDGHFCDCGCGMQDPDCDSNVNPTNCPNDNRCVNGVCAYPKKWNANTGGCAAESYNASDGVCNCGCGAYDPDCDGGKYETITGCGDLTQFQFSCDFNGDCLRAFCGNGFVDIRLEEECDGGLGCIKGLCKCSTGYKQHNETSLFCDPICGDGIRVDGEECDGSLWCDNKTCSCLSGHPVNGTPGVCTGCGNHIAEYGEECDGGEGCTAECKCGSGYKPYAHLESRCYKESNATTVAVVCVCCGIVVLAVIVIVVWAILSHRTKKIVESADSRIEKNNEIIREEEENTSLPGQVPMALLSKDQTLLTSTSTGATTTDLGSTNTLMVQKNSSGDYLASTMTEDLGSGAGMTLDEDDEPKKKTIKISIAPPPN